MSSKDKLTMRNDELHHFSVPERFVITRKIEIDAAHRVPDHQSKCFAVHGHRYVIEATCAGELIDRGEQRGMVMDFGFLKECMMTAIHDPCDHGIILWSGDTLADQILESPQPWWKLRLIESVPTAENLARVWFADLKEQIGLFFAQRQEDAPQLMQIRVFETPNCWAEYPW